jgi:hypothetical protein
MSHSDAITKLFKANEDKGQNLFKTALINEAVAGFSATPPDENYPAPIIIDNVDLSMSIDTSAVLNELPEKELGTYNYTFSWVTGDVESKASTALAQEIVSAGTAVRLSWGDDPTAGFPANCKLRIYESVGAGSPQLVLETSDVFKSHFIGGGMYYVTGSTTLHAYPPVGEELTVPGAAARLVSTESGKIRGAINKLAFSAKPTTADTPDYKALEEALDIFLD